MIFYSKITAKNNMDSDYHLFQSYGATEDNMILDTSLAPKKQGSVFHKVKDSLINNNMTLVIDSLRSLGKTNREIAKELQWLRENKISLKVIDLPVTFEDNVDPIKLLAEVFTHLSALEIQNVKEKQAEGIKKSQQQNKPLGRKRIPYPSNWEVLYWKWEKKEITISEFKELSGLKKGTLYNLIKQYKNEIQIAKEA